MSIGLVRSPYPYCSQIQDQLSSTVNSKMPLATLLVIIKQPFQPGLCRKRVNNFKFLVAITVFTTSFIILLIKLQCIHNKVQGIGNDLKDKIHKYRYLVKTLFLGVAQEAVNLKHAFNV